MSVARDASENNPIRAAAKGRENVARDPIRGSDRAGCERHRPLDSGREPPALVATWRRGSDSIG
jgi:hypothetical protein